jgi:hypothetical protein
MRNALALMVAGLVLAGCGGGSEQAATTTTTSGPSACKIKAAEELQYAGTQWESLQPKIMSMVGADLSDVSSAINAVNDDIRSHLESVAANCGADAKCAADLQTWSRWWVNEGNKPFANLQGVAVVDLGPQPPVPC